MPGGGRTHVGCDLRDERGDGGMPGGGGTHVGCDLRDERGDGVARGSGGAGYLIEGDGGVLEAANEKGDSGSGITFFLKT